MGRLVVLVVALLVALLLGSADGAAAPTQATKLFATVGPEFTIGLEDAQGNRVTKLDPGDYEIEVTDLSDFHNFHLEGAGVDETTGVEFTGKLTWRVTFRDGVYTFKCDVHPSAMRGSITVGNPPTTPPPSSTGTVTAKSKLVLTTGPEQVITLRTSAGKPVKAMKVGTYTVVVRDRGRIHNAHVVAPGYNRVTKPLSYIGTQTWKVRLAKTGTLRFLCDPHALVGMKGSAKIVR